MKQIGVIVRFVVPAAVAAAAMVATGCVAFETPEEQDVRIQQMASINSDVQILKDERQRLIQQLEVSRQENAQLTMQVKDLSDRLDLVEQRFGNLDGNYRRKLEELQRTIASESAARKTAVDDVVRSVSKEISSTANRLQEQQRRVVKAAVDGAPQGEYVVQKRDTLAAIAKAFGVSSSSLARANNIKGSSVRPGQKLTIPKK
ncbi:MAG: LysM peptidoglycan-binding domain-containing protein [Lentisphaeria bacterium]